MKNLLILAGEHSGDILGARLVSELQKMDRRLSFVGTGGRAMGSAGVEILEDIEKLNVTGILEILLGMPRFFKLKKKLKETVRTRGIRTVILIDFPGFHLAMAKVFKAMGMRVIYYVSPDIWVWHFSRIRGIKKNVDLMLVLFPFEKKIYDQHGVPSVCVGHPLGEIIRTRKRRWKEKRKRKSVIRVTLMPGSRSYAIRIGLPVMIESAVLLSNLVKDRSLQIHFHLPNINEKMEPFLKVRIDGAIKKHPGLHLHYSFGDSVACMSASELVWLGAGSSVVEAVLLGKPVVHLLKVNGLVHFLFHPLVRVKFISLVNILAGREIFREFLQRECLPQNIADESMKILFNKKYRLRMQGNILAVQKAFGRGNASQEAARAIHTFLKQEKSVPL